MACSKCGKKKANQAKKQQPATKTVIRLKNGKAVKLK